VKKSRPNILLTNDDGIQSTALSLLFKELSKFADVTIITPHFQRSGGGKAITINNIIRLEKNKIDGDISCYTISGTAADAIIFALNELPERPFDFVVSGINMGLNLSAHIILTSGTCAAAFEAAFMGVPAVAFSMDVHSKNYFVSPEKEVFKITAAIAGKIVKKLLEHPYPEELAFFNVNFPKNVSEETPKEMSYLASRFIDFKPLEKKDPRKNKYYFLWGKLTKNIPKNSDVDIIQQNKISITPITKNFTLKDGKKQEYYNQFFNE
jgi:5'-nucleotidase